jgi:hypothetical protein
MFSLIRFSWFVSYFLKSNSDLKDCIGVSFSSFRQHSKGKVSYSECQSSTNKGRVISNHYRAKSCSVENVKIDLCSFVLRRLTRRRTCRHGNCRHILGSVDLQTSEFGTWELCWVSLPSCRVKRPILGVEKVTLSRNRRIGEGNVCENSFLQSTDS